MALSIVEYAGLSDVGRQREANEDSYVVAAPMFAVADGMGGAQAGEVASRLAAEAFEDAAEDAGTPEQRLVARTTGANREIYELAQSDSSRRGMGTTLTAALVSDDGVSLAHVGDSRAYRLRDGELVQLTDDHSLVAELLRSGQLSPEAAENHPQKSIITRALGPEADVEVDAHTHAARADDVYLLCSDGLTGMIGDSDIAGVLRGAGSLEDAAQTLIQAANQRGGRDNITVVLFRLGDGGGSDGDHDTLSGQETMHRGMTAADVHDAVADQERAAVRSPTRTRSATAPASGPAARRSVARRLSTVLAVVIAIAAVGVGLWAGARQVYFLGTSTNGLVTLYRGVPYDLPFGVALYSSEYESSVPASTLARQRRARVLDHEWRSRSDAHDLVRQLERGTLDDEAAAR